MLVKISRLLLVPSLITHLLLLPKKGQPKITRNPLICEMSLATVGAVVLIICIAAYAMSHGTDSDVDLHNPKVFQERKDLYRKRRDDFRSNSTAMEELREWKAGNDDYDYVEL